MKVLLVSANMLTSPYPVYPLGLDYIRHVLSAKHQVEIADMNVLQDHRSLESLIGKFQPDYIGLSIRNIDNTDITDPKSFVNNYADLAKTIRACSSVPLILGGSGFTIFAAELMTLLKADYGIIGEGERLGYLLDALEKDSDLSKIPGIITAGSDAVIPDPFKNVFKNTFSTDSGHLSFYLKKGGMLNIQTKRGCCFKCVYCTYPHIEGSKMRLFPPGEIAETAIKFQNAGAKYFFVTDSAFNADYSHSIEVAKAFKKAHVSIPWGAFFTPTSPPRDYYKILADSGLTHVEFGTESLSGPVLSRYQKAFRVENVFEAHREAVDAGLYVAHYLLLGGPGEKSVSIKETISNVDKLDKTVLFFFCGMRIYPYTDLFKIAVQEGQITHYQNLLEPVFYQNTDINMDEIICQIKKMAETRPHWMIGAGGDQAAQTISKMYDRGFSGPLWELLIR